MGQVWFCLAQPPVSALQPPQDNAPTPYIRCDTGGAPLKWSAEDIFLSVGAVPGKAKKAMKTCNVVSNNRPIWQSRFERLG